MIRLNTDFLAPFLAASDFDALRPRVLGAHEAVLAGSGPGNEFLGWRRILLRPDDSLLEDIAETARSIREQADVLLCIGIGGSYLGAKAVIDTLSPHFRTASERETEVLFAGQHISGRYLDDLLKYLGGKSVFVNVISKSGTTLEPAVAFRVVRRWLKERFADADSRIIVTTDPERGTLNELRRQFGYKRFVIPPDIGGRFSVLSPVGLLPIATAGIDIRSLFYGAADAADRLTSAESNPALEYAAARYLLHEAGYATEALAVFEPSLSGLGRWWQHLFGESEGKSHRGLFPVGVLYSTDLHSIGQYMQDGRRTLIETFLIVSDGHTTLTVPDSDGVDDGLAYLTGQSLESINRRAYKGTARAHVDGGVPNMTIEIPDLDAPTIGALLYMFQHAVAVGGYLLGVNPFDQPGVEAYKSEMYKLLRKELQ